MKSGFRATRSPFVNILAFFNVVASRQISPHQFCKGKPIFPNSKIFFPKEKKLLLTICRNSIGQTVI